MTVAPRRTLLRLALSAATLTCALASGSASASSPLDHPPRLTSFKLDDAAGSSSLSLLRAYFDAEVERPGPYGRYIGGPFGKWSKQPWIPLSWGNSADRTALSEQLDGGLAIPDLPEGGEPTVRLASDGMPSLSFGFAAPPADHLPGHIQGADGLTRLFVTDDQPRFWTTGPSLASNGFDTLWAQPTKPVIDWRCRRRPVLFVRYGGQSDRFSLVRCNGAIEPGAVDRLSIVARPPEAPDPGELPEEPDPEAWEKGEWLPQVKLMNPRLLWLVQKIADAFPHRAIYIYSGYRPHKEKTLSLGGGHHSLHGDGRAMDIQVHGIRNESLFAYCRKLEDVGCGYYPNSKFVHVDVRRPGTGHALWIDTSGPGEPSHYVDSWPGVVDHGALAWERVAPKDTAAPQGQRPRMPDDRGSADVTRK